jgi:hypothetical protein
MMSLKGFIDMQLCNWSGRVRCEWPEDEPRKVIILEQFTFTDSRGWVWTVPADVLVDGASIPWFLWRAIGSPFCGYYRRASVVHDVYCNGSTVQIPESGHDGPWFIIHEPTFAQAHAVFFEMMRCDGVWLPKAIAMWMGVRFCGPGSLIQRIWRRLSRHGT